MSSPVHQAHDRFPGPRSPEPDGPDAADATSGPVTSGDTADEPAAPPTGGPDAATAPDAAHDAAWSLVRAAQDGDADAFGKLYDRYVDVVFRYVLFRVNDRALAEDVTSETFVRAFRRITTVSYQGRDVGAWFVTIARNLVLDHVKSARNRLEMTTADIVEPAGRTVSATGPEHEVIARATRDELLRCVEMLNPDQRECIVLRFLQGLSVAETAQLMKRNDGAVKALQHRAVRRLAQLLPEGTF